MFSSNLRLVPWRNKEEWMKVYDDAYSSDSNRQSKACRTMETWLLLRNDVPPGVECTLNILSAIKEEELQSSRQLQLILSTAVLRVVNMLCDNARISGKETLYSIAKFYNLPDWIVNLRHDVSHGTLLPDITTLKRAGTFLLSWLREYYWEIENENMRDIILKRSREEACRDNVEFYINSYVDLMEQFVDVGNVKIKNVSITDIVYKMLDINKRSGFKCAIECLPWIAHSRDSFAREIPEDDIPSMKISLFVKHLLQHFQDYVSKKSFWQFDPLPLLANAMSSHYNKHKSIVRKIWEPMIQKLNDWKELDRLMIIFFDENRINDEACLLWFYELSRSIFKRHMSDIIRVDLSASIVVSSNAQEQALACNSMLRKRLSLASDCSDKTVQLKLFHKVEKKHVFVKEVFQLTAPVQYILEKCSALNMIEAIVLNPNNYTVKLLKCLFPLVSPEFSNRKKEELLNLVQIQLGKKFLCKISSLDNLQIKTINDLDQMKLPVSQNHSDALNDNMEIADDKSDIDENFEQQRSNFEWSNWDFNTCPLGATPWQLDGIEYYHKPYDRRNPVNSFIFPISTSKI